MAFLYRPSILVLKKNENLGKKTVKKLSKEGLIVTEVDDLDEAKNQVTLVNYDAVIVLEKKDNFFSEKELAPFFSYSVLVIGPEDSKSKTISQISFLKSSELDSKLVPEILNLIEGKKLNIKAA